MRLKRIDIKGFKSFAKETILHFNEDVVGVVGPNGSGKSNIVDAIRWVLGEQKSRELRLDKMSDVIFNGTKKRKAGGLAQVTITFENHKNLIRSEFQTIAISRILYRDGNSEYRINNVPCRLKDIHSLLQDTGVGSNTYAIIALGMVDDILADKEQSRRKMFEQAAGISKYKQRKHQTLLKLKNTEEDLNRVEDLLFEIEGNLKALEKQAKRTKKYFELKEKYKAMVIQLTQEKSKHLQYEFELTKKQITENEDHLREAQVKSTQLEAQLAKIKKDNIEQEQNVTQLQRDLNELVNVIRRIESDKSLDQQKISFKQQNVGRIKDYVAQQEARLENLKKEIAEKSDLIIEEEVIRDKLAKMLDEKSGEKDQVFELYGTAKSELEGLQESFQTQEKQIFELEKKLAITQNQNTFHNNQVDRLSKDQEGYINTIRDLNIQFESLVKEHDSVQNQLKEVKRAENERKQKLDDLNLKRETEKDQLIKLQRQLDSKQNEHDLLKSLVENFEGFPQSIQFLSKSKKWDRKAPLLTDLIYCSEQYRIVVEQFLENFLNYFVVDNKTDAIKAIRLLSSTQKGKANFFILDSIQPTKLLERNIPEAIPIKQVVEVEDKYRQLTDMLFHNVFIIDGDITDFINNDQYNDCTFLSLDGKLIAQRGSRISGGSIGLFEGKKIGRKKNLDKLTKEIQSILKNQSKLEDQLAKKANQIKTLEEGSETDKIQQLSDVYQQMTNQKFQIETQLRQSEQQLEKLVNEMSASDRSMVELKSAEKEIVNDLDSVRLTYEEISDQIKKQGAEYEELLNSYNQESQHFNEAKIELIKHENSIQNLKNDLEFSTKQIEQIQTDLVQQGETLENDQVEIVESEKRMKQQEGDLLIKYEHKKQLEAQLSDVEESYFKIRGEVNEIEEQIKTKQREAQQSNYLINELKDKFADTKYQLQAIYERTKIEFDITQDNIDSVEYEPLEMSFEVLEEKVDRLKIRLNNFGEINPLAVEAYDAMNERYESIVSQRNDIVEAKESLLDTIDEIENTATAKYLEAFNEVREYFKEVFRSLFSEDDDCDLILLDPENPLESKIEIIAKPKGKRPVTLSQLSGGEKTLTATALLFAMYLLKPAPFCIFDEVDAPLDDANVEKFNRIIKKFSETSQFIIVTHNKLTMAAVDVIYGVYMEEQGVSNVSQVDFRSYDHRSIFELEN